MHIEMKEDWLTADEASQLKALERHAAHGKEFRILRHVPPCQDVTPEALPIDGRWVAILDTETSGLCPKTHRMIEIAFVMLALDGKDQVIGVFGPVTGLEDPRHRLDPAISRLTGLTDTDLSGKVFDEQTIVGILSRASLIIAHNCGFDLSFVEQRFPDLRGKAWADSCGEIDWPTYDFDGRGLGYLLMQCGYFSKGHRAEADVWKLHTLLNERYQGKGVTYFERLLTAANRTSVRLEATGAPYALKDALKARQYRWDADCKVWWRAMELDDAETEKRWLIGSGVTRPTEIIETATERHRPPQRDIVKVRPWDVPADDAEPF